MKNTLQKSLTIIGAGKLGKTLGKLWALNQSFLLRDMLNQSPGSTQNAIAFIGAGRAAGSYADLRSADIYLLSTSDEQIASSCAALAQTGLLTAGSIIFHCSGALPSSVLQPAIDQGAATASIHPIRSFAEPEQAAQNFTGTWCGMEGDQRALDVLVPAFQAIGAQLVPVKTEAKIHYHAAAVFASNYLVTLLDVAKQSYVQAGIAPDIAFQLMAPLVRETVENVFKLGPETALTGPIARGDMATAERQWRAVAAAIPTHGDLYEKFMQLTVELARRRQAPKQ